MTSSARHLTEGGSTFLKNHPPPHREATFEKFGFSFPWDRPDGSRLIPIQDAPVKKTQKNSKPNPDYEQMRIRSA